MLAAAHNIKCGENKPVLQKLLSKTDINIRSKVVGPLSLSKHLTFTMLLTIGIANCLDVSCL